VQKLEMFLHSTYTYFSFSPRRHLALQVCSIVGDERNTLLCHVKIRWISMLFLANKVLKEYRPLVVRMIA
jgi:hypothetical protein